MTLPTSGALHMADIGYEAGKPLMSQVDMNSVDLRKLANKLTNGSQISVQDFYGTAYGVGPGYGAQAFTDKIGVGLNVYITTETIYLHDAPVGGAAMALQSTATDASYSINGGAWIDKSVLGSVKRGDSIALRIKSSGSQNTTYASSISYAGITKPFSITTGATVVNKIYLSCVARNYSSLISYAWYLDRTIYVNAVYSGIYSTPGQWIQNPVVPASSEVVKYWAIECLQGDSMYAITSSNNTTIPTGASTVVYQGSPPTTQSGVYMGLTGIRATASFVNGYRLEFV